MMKNNETAAEIRIPNINTGEPNITMAPLIDVVFLLLIFFVVATVFPENRGLIVEKPTSESNSIVENKKLTFIVSKKKEIFYKKQKITSNDVNRLVRDFLAANSAGTIMLQVDKMVTTQMLINVMDACKLGGASRIVIATEKNDPSF